uniref:Uncharacterized protein n=1 Tax=Romanomermis culicivorax TaxID=13658 RepID=A0A915HX65_ROMCU
MDKKPKFSVIQPFSSRAKCKNHIENIQPKFENQAINEELGFFNNFRQTLQLTFEHVYCFRKRANQSFLMENFSIQRLFINDYKETWGWLHLPNMRIISTSGLIGLRLDSELRQSGGSSIGHKIHQDWDDLAIFKCLT